MIVFINDYAFDSIIKALKHNDWRLMMLMVKKANAEQEVFLSPQEGMSVLGIRQANTYYSAINRLEKLTIIKKTKGKNNSYTLNDKIIRNVNQPST